MVTFISHSPADTQALGEEWGGHASSGLAIGLSGDLGAGKTQLVKGLARGLGFAGRVHSPSFGLVNEYTGGRRISKGPDGQLYADEAVLEFDPPRRLVHGWRSLYSPELAAEPTSRVTWEIAPQDGGYCLLTVVHDKLEGSPRTAENVSGEGWMMVLSGLKTLVETGTPMTG